MSISIDWGSKTINVPKVDLVEIQTVPFSIYELDLNTFRLALKALEDTDDGIAFDRTHKHNTQVTLAGTTFARTVEIINGYTVTFENDQYRVNAIGANSNIADVTNLNLVSLSTANSAGLIVTNTGSSTAADIWSHDISGITGAGTAAQEVKKGRKAAQLGAALSA